MKLFKDEWQENVKILEESDGLGGKQLFIEGIFLQTNRKNGNSRIYSKEIVSQAVNLYEEKYISKSRAVGELGHPSTPSINLDRISHVIVSLNENGDDYIGKAKVLDTPMGRIAKSLINEGIQLAVSSRGTGSTTKRGATYYVNNDYRISTAADIVFDPSAPDAFVNGIMENQEWIYDASTDSWLLAEELKNKYKKLSASQVSSVAARDFYNFLKNVR